jgi:hypothetical protein
MRRGLLQWEVTASSLPPRDNHAVSPEEPLIMTPSTAARIICTAALLAGIPLYANAQQDAPRPPVLEKLEEGQPPEIKIVPTPSQPVITQKREQGKVTEVEVQTGKSTYVVKANEQPGSIHTGEGQSTAIRVPQWKVMEFDLGARKPQHEAPEPAAVPPPPPPPK